MRGAMSLKLCATLLVPGVVLAGCTTPATVPSEKPAVVSFSHSPSLQTVVDKAVAAAFEQFATSRLQSNQLAVTLVDLRDFNRPLRASYRGEAPIYPASVV